MIIASLFSFSSCGTKGSNNFREISFLEAKNVRILYNEREYDGVIKFNGNLLELTVFTDGNKEDSFEFSVDEMTCTTDFKGLTKTEHTNQLPDDFLPVIIFSFLSQTGAEFVTEIYDEELKNCSVSRKVGNMSVCLDTSLNEDHLYYVIKIN